MKRYKSLLLASALIPVFALSAATIATAQTERLIVAQAATTDPNAKNKQQGQQQGQKPQTQQQQKPPMSAAPKPTTTPPPRNVGDKPAQPPVNQPRQTTTTAPSTQSKPVTTTTTTPPSQGKPLTTTTTTPTGRPGTTSPGDNKPVTTTTPPPGTKPVTGQPIQTQTQNPVGRPVGQPGTGTPPSQVTTTPSGQKPFGDGGGRPGGQQPVTQPVMQPKPPFNPPVTQQATTGPRRLDDLRKERREVKDGNRVMIQEGGRTIIRENNQVIIRHSEVDRFRFNARDVRTERRGNEDFTFIERANGVRIINVVGPDGRLLRRIRRDASGREVILIDNSFGTPGSYFVQLPPPVIRIPRERYVVESEFATPAILLSTLLAPPVEPLQRRYTLDEIRYSAPVRDRMPRIDIDTVNFETGSWEVAPSEAQRLAPIANAMQQAIAQNPNEMFLIEGYTDAVGNDVDNLSLSDRRAESVAQVLTEQFQIPPENLSTQGYGEQNLKVPTQGPMRENRRVSVRRITLLLNGQQN